MVCVCFLYEFMGVNITQTKKYLRSSYECKICEGQPHLIRITTIKIDFERWG